MKNNIHTILRNWRDFEWSIQGFGMLRTYIDPRVRLHVWYAPLSYPEVSTIHDHPWDFESRIIVGRMRNVIYTDNAWSLSYMRQRIVCGSGGGPIGEPKLVRLWGESQSYVAGETYKMKAPQLHASFPDDGTVSLIIRDFHENTEEAHVCYPKGKTWVSAEPRPATDHEVLSGITAALRLF